MVKIEQIKEAKQTIYIYPAVNEIFEVFCSIISYFAILFDHLKCLFTLLN